MKIAKLIAESAFTNRHDADLIASLANSAEALVELVKAALDAYDNGYDRQKMERALAALGEDWQE